MQLLLLLRKADEMGINFWLRLLALGLFFSLVILSGYYFLVINQDQTPEVKPPPSLEAINEAEKRKADTALITRIKSALAQSKRLYNHNIGVESKAGQVTLSGEVPTEIDKDLAGSLAKEMPGVKEVRNQLQIVPSPKLAVEAEEKPVPAINIENLEMEANLREKIQAVAELKDQPIKIKVQNREVTLTGRVASDAQRIKVEQILHDAPKVTIVHNQIRVGN